MPSDNVVSGFIFIVGTGKTTTIVEIISQSVRSGNKMLCCAPSNIAVDNLLERLVKNRTKVVRLGHPARINKELQKYSLDALISFSDQTKLVRSISIIYIGITNTSTTDDYFAVQPTLKELSKSIKIPVRISHI